MLSLTCLHAASMSQNERTDLSLLSNLATQIKAQKNKLPEKEHLFLSLMMKACIHRCAGCHLNIAFNHAITNCRIHSDDIFYNDSIYLFFSVLIGAHLIQHVLCKGCTSIQYFHSSVLHWVFLIFQNLTNATTPAVTVFAIY